MANNKQKPSSQKDFLTQLQKISKLPVWAWGVIIGSLLLLIAILYLSNFQIDFNAGKVNFDRKIKLSQAEKDLSAQYSKNFKQYDKDTFESEANISKITQNLNSANGSSKTGFAKLFDKITFWRGSSSENDTSQQSESTNNNSGDIKQKIAQKLGGIPVVGKSTIKDSPGWIEPGVEKGDIQNGRTLYSAFGIVKQVGDHSITVQVSKYVDRDLTLSFSGLIKVWIWQPQQNDWQVKLSTTDIKHGDAIGFRWWGEDANISEQSDLKTIFDKLTAGTWNIELGDVFLSKNYINLWKE